MVKKCLLLMVTGLLTVLTTAAESFTNMEPLKLEVPEMKPELVATDLLSFEQMPLSELSTNTWSPDFSFFKTRTNPDVKPFKVMDDLTFVGIPLFAAGWAIKGDKAMFRVNNKDGKKNTQLLTDFKTGIDDYTQYFGPAMTVGLKLAGVEGRSDWPRLLANAAMSYGIMAALVNGIKYTAKEMRPDGSSANSWPSGHTATSFVGATLLHEEYGLTRSPWYSVAGYGIATATGVMRVLNNRHWVSDVMSGAGIGIMSTELGYALGDILFKGKGLLRNNLELDSEDPSFFSISMGVGIGGKDIDFALTDLVDPEMHGVTQQELAVASDYLDKINIDFRSSTVVDAEGAYFFNKYIGVGGRFRVRAMSAKSFGQFADISVDDADWLLRYGLAQPYEVATNEYEFEDFMAATKDGLTGVNGIIKSDHLTEFIASAGLFFNLPINDHFSVGTKLLLGRSFCQELDIDGVAEGKVKDISYDMGIKNGQFDWLTLQLPTNVKDPENPGQDLRYSDEWSYLTLGADNSTAWSTGLSLTYRYKSNFSWKIFIDYDYSEKTYTMTYDPFHFLKKGLTSTAYSLLNNRLIADQVGKVSEGEIESIYYSLEPEVYRKDKKMNYFTVGLSFAVNF